MTIWFKQRNLKSPITYNQDICLFQFALCCVYSVLLEIRRHVSEWVFGIVHRRYGCGAHLMVAERDRLAISPFRIIHIDILLLDLMVELSLH